jgi:hypothetical protein
VPVREVTYQGGVQFGYLMSELSAYYDAFGYAPHTEDAPDHLGIQLGFISFLKIKQALAVLDQDPERAAIAAEAGSAFIKEHVAVQAEPVLARLENFGPDFLIEAGRLILKYAGPSPRSNYPLSSSLAEDDDSEAMCCGPAAAGSDELVHLQP